MERLLVEHAAGPVLEQINPRARRISLRVDLAKRRIVLVRPPRASEKLVAAFLADQQGWIARQLSKIPQASHFADGANISIWGDECVVRAAPSAKRGVWRDAENIFVSGTLEHLPRRLKDWLKDEARKTFAIWAKEFAAKLDVKVTHVSVRDTKARWGSCTRSGRLSLSWRLVLAPREVAAYVVAHEVAHLKHMNHSPSFWRVVETLVRDIKTPRAWLRRHGAELHRYT